MVNLEIDMPSSDLILQTRAYYEVHEEFAAGLNLRNVSIEQRIIRKCRENFTETGDFVDYPRALIWAVKYYEEAHLDSWIIQYPVLGFNKLIRWYDE